MRLPGLWTIVGVLLVAGLIYLILEPVKVFGISGTALGESLERESPEAHGSSNCKEQEGNRWLCFAGTDTGTGAAYEMTVDEDGCWEADRIPFGADKTPPAEHFTGCINLLDAIGLSKLFDV